MIKSTRTYFSIVALAISQLAYSQKFSTSFDLQLSLPQGEYKEVSSNAGFGLRGNILYRPSPHIPLQVGLELGIQEKGRVTEYFTSQNWYFDEYEVSATNNIFSLMFLTRFQPAAVFRIKPFIDLMAGWNLFFSRVNVDRLTYYESYTVSNRGGGESFWALNYGGAAGLDIPLNKKDEIGLEIKVAYLLGNNTGYLANPYINNDAEVTFTKFHSRTDMLIPQLGVRFMIK